MREIVMPLHMYSAKQNIQKSEFVILRHHSESCRKQAIDQISDVAGLAERPLINPVPAIEGKQFQPILAHEAPEMSLPYIGYTFKRFETNYQSELARPISTNFKDLDPTLSSRPGPSAASLPSARRTAYPSKATYTPSSLTTIPSSLDFGPPRSPNAPNINNNSQGGMKGFRQRIVPDRQARLPVIESQEKNSQDARGRLDQPKIGSPLKWQENQAQFVGVDLAAGYEEDQLSLARQLLAEFGSGSKKSKKEDTQDRVVRTVATTGLPSVEVPEMPAEEVRLGLGPMIKNSKGDRAPSWKLTSKPAVNSRSSLTTTPLPQMPTSTFPTGKDTLSPMNKMLEPVKRRSATSRSIFTPIDESRSTLSQHRASPTSYYDLGLGGGSPENTSPEAVSRVDSSNRIFGSQFAEQSMEPGQDENERPGSHVLTKTEEQRSKELQDYQMSLLTNANCRVRAGHPLPPEDLLKKTANFDLEYNSQDVLQDFDFDSFLHQDGEIQDFDFDSFLHEEKEDPDSTLVLGTAANDVSDPPEPRADLGSHFIPPGLTQADLETKPLYVNPKQFHRILRRRVARQKLEEVLKSMPKKRKPYLYESRHGRGGRRPRAPDGRILTAEVIAELKESFEKSGELTPLKAPSTRLMMIPEDPRAPNPGTQLWWMAYTSLHQSHFPTFATANHELEKRFGALDTSPGGVATLCKKLSGLIQKSGTATYADKPELKAIVVLRDDIIRIVATVDEQLGLEIAIVGWSCVWVCLAVSTSCRSFHISRSNH
jgi:hypothetical protein